MEEEQTISCFRERKWDDLSEKQGAKRDAVNNTRTTKKKQRKKERKKEEKREKEIFD